MGRKKKYIREEVIDKAKELFWLKGFEGTHLQELVQVTGLNRFSLYSEFDGKEGLFSACIKRYLDEADEYYQSTLLKEPLGVKNILNYFNQIEFDKNYHGCFFVNTLTEKNNLNADTFSLVKNYANKVEDYFFMNLSAAAKKEEIKDSKLRSKATLLTAQDQGLAIYGIVNPTSQGLRDLNFLITAILNS